MRERLANILRKIFLGTVFSLTVGILLVSNFPIRTVSAANQQYFNYKLPWESTETMIITRQPVGWHGLGWSGKINQALDFAPTDKKPKAVLAMAEGKITKLCINQGAGQIQTYIGITTTGTTEEMVYFHVDKRTLNPNVRIGATIKQGEKLGVMIAGTKDERGSVCNLYSEGTHLHIVFPNKNFQVDGYTFTTFPNGNLKILQSGKQINARGAIKSTNSIPVASTPTVSCRTNGQCPVYRFYNSTTDKHFFTIWEQEKESLAKDTNWKYEGIVFYAYKPGFSQISQLGLSPVYRLLNTKTVAHYYTIWDVEKNNILKDTSWKLEGVGFYAYKTQNNGSKPVYKFYNTTTGKHFFTISETEKASVINLPQWQLQGVSFYAFI